MTTSGGTNTRVVSTNDVAFFVGDAAEYNSAATISSDGIYFIRDTGSIYRGGREYGAGHIAVQDALNSNSEHVTGKNKKNDQYSDSEISTYGQVGIVKPNVLTFKVNSDGRLDLIHLPSDVINSSLWYSSSTDNNIPEAIQKYVTTVHHLKRQVVDSLPSNPDVDTIYMLKVTDNDDPGTTTDNLVNYYDEYMYINNKWELIGDSRTVLKDYAYWKDAVMRTGVNGDVQEVKGGLKLTALNANKGTLTTGGEIAAGGNVVLPSGANYTVTNVKNPTSNTDAANKQYVDNTSINSRKQAEINIVNGFSSPDKGQLQISTADGGTKKVTIAGWNDLSTLANKNQSRLNTLETVTIPDIQGDIKDLENANTIANAVYNSDTVTDPRKTTKGVVDIAKGKGIEVSNGTLSLSDELPSKIRADKIIWQDKNGYPILIPSSSVITVGDQSLETWVLEKINAAGHISYQIVPDGQSLDDIQNKDAHTIYMIKQSASEEENYYDEYMYINGKFELIGDSKAILADYYNKTETDKRYIQPSELTFSEGNTNGQFEVFIKGNKQAVSVHGLKDTAYTSLDYFAKATDLNWNELSN